MTIATIAFTPPGLQLGRRLGAALGPGWELTAGFGPGGCGVRAWTAARFGAYDALVFIGAVGIAVRAVAPHLKGKATDPAVVVLDEGGRFVIPLVSDHLGGAGALARRLAALTGGQAVLTAASDVRGAFAFDRWARAQGMAVQNPGRIRPVAARYLNGGAVTVHSRFPIQGTPPPGVRLVGQSAALRDKTASNPDKSAGQTGQMIRDTGKSAVSTDQTVRNTGKTAGYTGQTVRDTGKNAGCTDQTVQDTGKTAGCTSQTVRDTGKTAGYTGQTVRDSGQSAGQAGKSAGNTGENARLTGESAGDAAPIAGFAGQTVPDTGKTAGYTGQTVRDSGQNAARRDTTAWETGKSAGFAGQTVPDTDNIAGALPVVVTLAPAPGDCPALVLTPRALIAGIGCRRGAAEGAIRAAVLRALAAVGVAPAALGAVATIDRKGAEPGLLAFCRTWGLPLRTFSPAALMAQEGDFAPSAFVRRVTGADNVCQRAAAAAGGRTPLGGKFIYGGVTVALALCDVTLNWEEEARDG